MDHVTAERPLKTYAQPLAGLQVSWGSILAGALALLAIATLLWALCAAIIVSVTHFSAGSVRGSIIALWVCAIGTLLIGGFLGGLIGGYLPGNPRRLVVMTHSFLSWALAFLMATGFGWAVFSSVSMSVANNTVATAGSVMQTAGSAVGGAAGGAMTFNKKAVNLLESLGYSSSEANQMVNGAQRQAQGTIENPPTQAAGSSAVQAAHTVFHIFLLYAIAATWTWFGTWFLGLLLALLGGSMVIGRLRRREPRELVREPLPRAPEGPVFTPTPHPI